MNLEQFAQELVEQINERSGLFDRPEIREVTVELLLQQCPGKPEIAPERVWAVIEYLILQLDGRERRLLRSKTSKMRHERLVTSEIADALCSIASAPYLPGSPTPAEWRSQKDLWESTALVLRTLFELCADEPD